MTEAEFEAYTDYITDTLLALLAIDSPTGYTENAADFVQREFTALGLFLRNALFFCSNNIKC